MECENVWIVNGIRFEVWPQYTPNNQCQQYAVKAVGDSGEYWLSNDYGRTDSISGAAYQILTYLNGGGDQ